MKRTILYLFILTATQPCVAQKATDMKTNEKFNYEYYRQAIGRDNIDGRVFRERDSSWIRVFINRNSDCVYKVIPLSFAIEVKLYHKNHILKKEGPFFYCSTIKNGIWREYDEEGNLIKETDEDEKFKDLKVKPHTLLDWFEKQGWIDRSTGKGQQEDFVTPFSISFAPRDKKFPARWLVIRHTMPGTEDFLINAETGEIISHEVVLKEK